MDGLWQTTWYEELLFIGFFLLVIFSLLLLIYAMGVTALAAMDKYSAEAAGLYWISSGLTFVILISGYAEAGILYYVFSSPVVAFAMLRMERKRKLKLSLHDNNN